MPPTTRRGKHRTPVPWRPRYRQTTRDSSSCLLFYFNRRTVAEGAFVPRGTIDAALLLCRFWTGIAMAPGLVVQRRHPSRPRAVAPMLPQELPGIAPHNVLDRTQKAPRVLLDVGFGVGAFLERDVVLDDDAMVAVVGLAHDEDRDHDRVRLPHQPRQRARGRRRLAEERNEHRLAALGVLIERDADQLTITERLEHCARGGTLAHDVDAGALAHPGHQCVAGPKALGVMDQGYLM